MMNLGNLYESSSDQGNEEFDLGIIEESPEGNIDLSVIEKDNEKKPVGNLTIVTEAIVEEITSIDESSYYEANEHIGENLFSQDNHLEYHQLINNTLEDLKFDIQEKSQVEEDKTPEMDEDGLISYGDQMYLITSSHTAGEEGSSGEIIDPFERPIIVSRSDVGDDTDNLLDRGPTTISDTNKQVSQTNENR